jgi:RNA polymerase sigma factor (sigma-70 family)
LTAPSASTQPATLVASLFRHESGRLVASLTRLFGPHNLQLAEDVVQDALECAMQAWKFQIPDNPTAWLSKVARNRALDVIRHGAIERRFADDYQAQLASEWTLAVTVEESLAAASAAENQLRMMLTVCQPQLSEETQVTLILKFLCGFAASEIAAAFLSTEETINKRVQRGRSALLQLGSLIPAASGGAGDSRSGAVLRALYLLFNEGYHGSHPSMPTRVVLCEEALRLCALMTEGHYSAGPQAHALMALMCFHFARVPGRVDAEGIYLPLAQQDRAVWDRALIDRGLSHLSRSASGTELSALHLEAGIACQHCLAPSLAATDWGAILGLYDLLYERNASPVIAINRALVRAYAGDPLRAMQEAVGLAEEPVLARYPFYWAARGEIHAQADQREEAQRCYQQAATLARSPAEQHAFLRHAAAHQDVDRIGLRTS